MTALLIKESVNQTVDNMGFYNSLQACFTLHQLNHAHWAEIHENKYPVADARGRCGRLETPDAGPALGPRRRRGPRPGPLGTGGGTDWVEPRPAAARGDRSGGGEGPIRPATADRLQPVRCVGTLA